MIPRIRIETREITRFGFKKLKPLKECKVIRDPSVNMARESLNNFYSPTSNLRLPVRVSNAAATIAVAMNFSERL